MWGASKENARKTDCVANNFDRCAIIGGIYSCSTELICNTAGSSGECCETDNCNDPISQTTTAKSTSSMDNESITLYQCHIYIWSYLIQSYPMFIYLLLRLS